MVKKIMILRNPLCWKNEKKNVKMFFFYLKKIKMGRKNTNENKNDFFTNYSLIKMKTKIENKKV